MVLEMVRYIPGRLRSGAKTNGRTARSNGRAGHVERSNASLGNIHRQCREWPGLNSRSRHRPLLHQETYIHDLNFEVEKLESSEGVDSAQVATATLHKDWLDIQSVDVSVQKGLANLFLSARAQKEKLEMEKSRQQRKADEASEKYFRQGEPRKRDHHADLTQIYQV